VSLALALAINAVAVVGLIGGLAFVMSRATKLTPHFAPVLDAELPQPQVHAKATRRAQGLRVATGSAR